MANEIQKNKNRVRELEKLQQKLIPKKNFNKNRAWPNLK